MSRRGQYYRRRGKSGRLILTLFLIGGLIAIVAAPGSSSWFLNWPVMLTTVFVLVPLLQGPLAGAHLLLRRAVRVAISFALLIALTRLLYWSPLWQMLGVSSGDLGRARPWLMVIAVLGWWVAVFWIIFSRSKAQRSAVGGSEPQRRDRSNGDKCQSLSIPAVRFSDIGGLEEAKEQIRQLVHARVDASKYKRYGIIRNGILLHGPRGSGKTLLAKATAGEFGLNFYNLSPTTLLSTWVGETERAIRNAFVEAISRRPVLFFIDEIDSLGTSRQTLTGGGDPGGAGRSYNNIAIELMQSIDQYRELPGFVLMAATNLLDGLDEALIRPGRFDLRLRIDLPDEPTRLKILQAHLAGKPWRGFDLEEFARKTPGWSPARICELVDQAALFAADEARKIESGDLRRAIEQAGCRDRPLIQPVQWNDIVLEAQVEQDLRTLVQMLNNSRQRERVGLEIPAGVLLVGSPGTGKSMIARLIATQTRRSFYPITAADVLGGFTGDSVKRVTNVFARAREHSPSIIFLDEMDGLLPGNNRYLSQHDLQVVEQFMIEISNLQPEHNVFLAGTANDLDSIDPRVLRGGRFSEKIEIVLPSADGRRRLLQRYLDGVRLEPGLTLERVSEFLDGFAPADLEAISRTAKRFAFNRAGQGDEIPPLNLTDFTLASERVRGTA